MWQINQNGGTKLQIEQKSIIQEDDHVQDGFRRSGRVRRTEGETNSSFWAAGHVAFQQAMPISCPIRCGIILLARKETRNFKNFRHAEHFHAFY